MNEQREQSQQSVQRDVTLACKQKESVGAALALLLGPETEYHTRVRAVRRLARQGPGVLPVLLAVLNSYPEITTPAWPWRPPQYEHCSHLLVYLARKAQLALAEILTYPTLSQPAGPVLWTSVIEAAGLLPHEDTEELLCQGLTTRWQTVRYAAAMALATRARHGALRESTSALLQRQLAENEELPIRITAAYALLNNGEQIGVDALLQLIDRKTLSEARKAALFILATELPFDVSREQNERLICSLLVALQDEHTEIALHAAQALSKIAEPSLLPTLCLLLVEGSVQKRMMVLTALEEMVRRRCMRQALRQRNVLSQLLPLLQSSVIEVRRQAAYVLAACGGEYVIAVLGTMSFQEEHPGHIEAIESLRQLYGVFRATIRVNVVRWLLQLSSSAKTESRVAALDSLVHLLWQARLRISKVAWRDMSLAVIGDGVVIRLLDDGEALIRQRAVELVRMLSEYALVVEGVQERVLHLLHAERDSGVRASLASTCGHLRARWALAGLLSMLGDDDEQVARAALQALEQIATPDDSAIEAALLELVHSKGTAQERDSMLVQEARRSLRKLRRGKRGGGEQEALQSSS